VAHGPDDEGKEAGDSEKPLSDDPGARADRPPPAPAARRHGHPYLVARATTGAPSIAGLQKRRLASAPHSTFGLSLLRRKGREGAGAALVAGAVGLSLLRRKD
jgi:hypothetical protein